MNNVNNRLAFLVATTLLCLPFPASAWDSDTTALPDLGTAQAGPPSHGSAAGLTFTTVGGKYSGRGDIYTVTNFNFSLSPQDGPCSKITGVFTNEPFTGPPESRSYDTYVFAGECTNRFGNLSVDVGRLFPQGAGDNGPITANTALFRTSPAFYIGWARVDGAKLTYALSNDSNIALAYGVQDGLLLGYKSDQAQVSSLRFQNNWLTIEATHATDTPWAFVATLTPPSKEIWGIIATPYLFASTHSNGGAAWIAQTEFTIAPIGASYRGIATFGAHKNFDGRHTEYFSLGSEGKIEDRCAIRGDLMASTKAQTVALQMHCDF